VGDLVIQAPVEWHDPCLELSLRGNAPHVRRATRILPAPY